MRVLVLIIVAISGVACAPKIPIRVLEPADVMAPSHIQTVAFIDRSRAESTGEKILGAVEGFLTGEEIGADNSGRESAEEAFRRTFSESPRFDLVLPGDAAIDGGLFAKALNWNVAENVCKQAGCQGIVALESFDSDSSLNTEMIKRDVQENGRTVVRKFWLAERETTVRTAWRFYDVQNRVIIDDQTGWSHSDTFDFEGKTEQGAVDQLPSQRWTIDDQGADAGDDYARRIAPNYITIHRKIYTSGDDNLKAAKDYVNTRNWSDAVRLWQVAAKSSNPKVKGRALYNMAVSKEVEGDLTAALELAERSNSVYPKGQSGRYAQEIRQRIYKNKAVQQSLKEANR